MSHFKSLQHSTIKVPIEELISFLRQSLHFFTFGRNLFMKTQLFTNTPLIASFVRPRNNHLSDKLSTWYLNLASRKL